jgi:hypothetical protein
MSLGLKITNINIMAQLKVKQISDFVSEVSSVHNGVVGTTTASAIATAKDEAIASAEAKDVARASTAVSNIATAKSQAIASAKSYSDGLSGNYDASGDAATAKSEAIASAEAKDVARASTAVSNIATAKSEAIASAESKDVARAATAVSNIATAKSEAIASAAATAESKDAARALTSIAAIKVQKDRIDALLADAGTNFDTFVEIKTFVDELATADIVGLTGAISTAKGEAIASAEAKDVARASTAVSNIATAKSEAIAAAEAKDITRATAASLDATDKADGALRDAKIDATAKDDLVLSTLRGEIATLAGTAKIEQIATFINATQFYLAKAVNDANNDVLVYVNGLQIHRSSVGVDGFSITNGGFNFQVSNLGYSLESNDHIVVIGIEHSNQGWELDPTNPKELAELPE